MVFISYRATICRLQDRSEEAVDLWRTAIDRGLATGELRTALTRAYVELDRMAEARMEFKRALALNSPTLAALCGLSECARELGEVRAGGVLLNRLRPFVQHCVVTTAGYVCLGSVAHFAGMAALLAGLQQEGLCLLEKALEVNRRLGALPALAATHCELARGYLEADRASEAGLHAQHGLGLAREVGMPLLERRATRLASVIEARAEGTGMTEPPVSPQQFVRCGEGWQLTYCGRTTRVSDLKGMHCLAALLARPGERLHVLELVAPASAGEVLTQAIRDDERGAVVSSLEGREAPLDAASIAGYRRRLLELASELEVSERDNDLGRKSECLREREFLERELLTCARVRHRPTERARKAVYNRIRQAIRHIAHHHAELGRHLILTIKTGVNCAYVPEHATSWLLSDSENG